MLDEIDRKIGLALCDSGMNISPTLSGYIIELDGDKRRIIVSEV